MYPGPEFPQLQFAKGPGRTGRTPFQWFAGTEVHARGRLRQEVSWTFLVLVPLWCLWKAIKQKREDAKKEALDVLKE